MRRGRQPARNRGRRYPRVEALQRTAAGGSEITDNLGGRFEIAVNSYKPFPCGVVIHPALDGCLQLRAKHEIAPSDIRRIDLRVHPLVLELTGRTAPGSGLESKFSVYHAVAAAMVRGRVGEAEFSDAAVRDPAIVDLRKRVTATADPTVAEDQVRIAVTLQDGSRLEMFVEHAIGSAKNPMTDSQLEAKFRGLAEGILSRDRVSRLLDLCWNIEESHDAAQIARAEAA